jgi:phosphoribosylformylglycinamidine cyclo-ligase
MVDYKDSGVNIELGDDVSKILYNAAKLTWNNRKGKLGEVVEIFPDFSGLRAIKVGGLPSDTYMNMGFDGVGTKVEIAERLMKHDTVAFDLFMGVCDDAVVRGAEPVLLGSILDVKNFESKNKNHIELVKQLAQGYIAAAKDANVAVVNGEVAELGSRINGYGEFNYNWGAGIVWFAKKDRMLTGREIKEGDTVIALKENGFRSNGLSLARKILEQEHGKDWHESGKQLNGTNIAELVLTPSRIYSAAVVEMFGGVYDIPQVKIHGVVNITGGGIPEKLGRALKPSGLGAELECSFEPPDIMQHIQDLGKVDDAEAYRTWNMGQGMLIITSEPYKVRTIAEKHNIEARKVGQIIKNPGIIIKSKGLFSHNEYLEF